MGDAHVGLPGRGKTRGAEWVQGQRYWVHFMPNLLSHVSK